jgi:hypothetical protein
MKPITLLALSLTAGLALGADSFYKEPPLFSTAPSETASLQTINRFGPVGIGIELHQPAFVMKVKNVEEGSPAAVSGKLTKGQLIETINGQQKYDLSPWRYRKVTYPQGMENWFTPGFNPAQAGWKKGQAPIGQYEGKLVTDPNPRGRFSSPAPMRSLWDKEVLLVRGTFQLPLPKPGYLYRIVVSTGLFFGAGDGYRVYLNGKQLVEVKEGIGRGSGGTLRGAFITSELLDEFGKGPVTLAATTFLRYGDRAIVTMPPVPQGVFSMWIEEMKLPPLDDAAFRKSAAVIPMLSAAWQEKQDPNNKELQTADDRFHYDGKFVGNLKVLGSWTAVATVPTLEAFDPAKPAAVKNAPFGGLTLKEDGQTDKPVRIWSGDTLIDMTRWQALKMTTRIIGDTEYLAVEAGGFSEGNPAGWKCPLIIMKRNQP